MDRDLDQTKRVDDETFKVIESVLMDIYSPTNPAVLLNAARTWYLAHGAGAVLRVMIDRLVEVAFQDPCKPGSETPEAITEFNTLTGVKPRTYEERI